jgi:hypothetical protein
MYKLLVFPAYPRLTLLVLANDVMAKNFSKLTPVYASGLIKLSAALLYLPCVAADWGDSQPVTACANITPVDAASNTAVNKNFLIKYSSCCIRKGLWNNVPPFLNKPAFIIHKNPDKEKYFNIFLKKITVF